MERSKFLDSLSAIALLHLGVGLAMQNICVTIPLLNLLCYDIAVDGLDTPTTLYDTLAVLSG